MEQRCLEEEGHGSPGDSSSPTCFVCLKSGEYDIFCNKDLCDRFLSFCLRYLKVGVDDVLRLKGMTGESEEGRTVICKTCERFVQDTLKAFGVFNEAKSKLLGRVNQLGLLISQRKKGDNDSKVVEAFIKQVEHQCKL